MTSVRRQTEHKEEVRAGDERVVGETGGLDATAEWGGNLDPEGHQLYRLEGRFPAMDTKK